MKAYLYIRLGVKEDNKICINQYLIFNVKEHTYEKNYK